MNFDRKKLFDGLRKRFGTFDKVQVEVVEAIVDEFIRRNLGDKRWLAYILATGWGECKWRPVEEIGKGKGKPYGKMINGKRYYGRGCPTQITHERNYDLLGKRLNLPLKEQPELALQVSVGVAIGFEGMIHGLFTAKKLADYFNATVNDPVNARRIINGTDKAIIFARWHEQILEVLQVARLPDAVPAPAPAPKPAADVPVLDVPVPAPFQPKRLPPTAEGRMGHALSILLSLVAIAAVTGAGLLIWAAPYLIGE